MDKKFSQVGEDPVSEADRELVEFVTSHCERWRDHKEVNYLKKWDEYERLYYGIWSDEDKTRESERSKIISPAIRQAVENKTSEIMEAVTGRGKYFTIRDDIQDPDKTDIEFLEAQLHEDLKKNKLAKALAEVNRNAEIYGTGIAEILMKEVTEYAPATQPIPGMEMAAYGVMEKQRTAVSVKPIHPKNFLIDPNSDTIEDALGVAIDEYTSLFKVIKGIEDGIYRKVAIGPEYSDNDLEPTQLDSIYQDEKVRVLRYYGLVPRKYLETVETEGKGLEKLFPDGESADYVDMVEAVIVIANNQYLLKAEENPYMMKDRPIVSYVPEKIPGRFWGCGTVEKGYNMQKAIDAQLRSHLDSLALTTAPMMAADATRLPRGANYKVQPGKTLLTNGNPNDILFPFKFGNTDPGNIETAIRFEGMLLQATGTLDSAALTQSAAAGEGAGASMSIAMSAILKKNKQALMNFQDDFMIPLVTKVAHRYMQFDPERYPVQDFVFVPNSTLGMVAREYEQQQFVGLLQTLGPDSPIVPMVLKGIIQGSSLSNREELSMQLEQMGQPSPEQQQMQQAQAELQMRLMQAQVAETEARAQEAQAKAMEAQAKAQKTMIEAQLAPEEMRMKMVTAAATNLKEETTDDFERRLKVANLALKDKEITSKENIVAAQLATKRSA